MRTVFKYLRPYAKRMSVGFLIKFIGTIVELALPWILAHLIDDIVPLRDTNRIFFWGIIMFFCSVLALVTNIIANRMAAKVARDTTRNIRHDLFARIFDLSSKQTDRFSLPSLVSRLTSDSYDIHRMINMMQRMGVRAPILLLGGLTLTMAMEAKLSLVLLATLPLVGIGVVFISRKGIPMYSIVRDSADNMVRVVRDNIVGVRVIKALSTAEVEKQRFEETNQELVDNEMHAGAVMGSTNPLMNFSLNMGLAAVILVGALLVNQDATEPGKIIAFLSYFTIILNAMLSVNRLFMMYSRASASAQRIEKVLIEPSDMPVQEPNLIDSPYHIQFDNVTFSYNKRRPNLKNISFALRPGETLGIIGSTGSGKTTIINLLQRFYDTDEGSIRIGGQTVESIPSERLHTMFGVAFQNDVLFADSIYANIDFARSLPKEQIYQGATYAQADEFINTLPGRFDYKITAKGTNLSGGQKQRLFIARAMAGNPEILILDDSSSALDYQTDARMRGAIARYFPNTTTILIAQRISSIRHADQILVLEDGAMLGLGTHDELMATCDVYRQTSEIQMGGEEYAATQ